tara:strand:- start:9427 stop:10140 length:714 start_codon:yes stop_codon:yes gene_type:complete
VKAKANLTAPMLISIVIPTFNEASSIKATLQPLQSLREQGRVEVILSDGGSTDATFDQAQFLVDEVVCEVKGRAAQMNAGADRAKGECLLFLHADTQLPDNFVDLIAEAMPFPSESDCWGFFPVRLSGQLWSLRIVERFMNLRSRLSAIATGDQALFVSRALWQKLCGFADIPLMEDVEFSSRARKVSRPRVMRGKLVTSSRRWEQRGVVPTVLLMWKLRWLYFRGVNPQALSEMYR